MARGAEIHRGVNNEGCQYIKDLGVLQCGTFVINLNLYIIVEQFEAMSLLHLTKFDPKLYEGVFLGYSQTSKAYIVLNKEIIRIKESLNVTFDESLPEPKSSPLVEDDRINEPTVQNPVRSSSLEVNVLESGYP
nr:retrovirus-related Pol polyprotein from transposon TNT 1-94 [Tanacetum cinerariifolium]